MIKSDYLIDVDSEHQQTVLHSEFEYLSIGHDLPTPTVPAMITDHERNALYQLGKRYTGVGEVVDAGCFLGASTVALAAGIRDSDYGRSGNDQKIIHSYDIGVLPARKNPNAAKTKRYGNFVYTFGDSFVAELEKNIREYSELVQLHIGDILSEQWRGDPIEICFLDLCKTVSVDQHAAHMFFSNFIPGKTILIQQDYFFHRLPWIKCTLGAFAEHFEWIGRVAYSSIYRCVSNPSATQLSGKLFQGYDVDSLLRLHQFPHPSLLDERTKFKLKISEIYLLALKDRKDQAMQGLVEIKQQYQDQIKEWDEHALSRVDSSYAEADASSMLQQADRQIRLDHVQRNSW